MKKEINLLEELNEGWHFPYRAKKAHYFKNGVSLCSKYRISVKDMKYVAFLPTGAFLYERELCKKCYDIWKTIPENQKV